MSLCSNPIFGMPLISIATSPSTSTTPPCLLTEHRKAESSTGTTPAIVIDGFPVGVFNGTEDGRKTLVRVFGKMIDTIRARWPDCIILLRADSGFNSTALIDLCEKKDIFYLIGLAPNKRLVKKMTEWEPQFVDVLRRSPLNGGNLLRHYGEVDDYQSPSWSGPRRVIARDYWSDERREWDSRFIQTNIPRTRCKKAGRLAKFTAKELYEQVYCRRGMAEQHSQEFKIQAFGARVRSSRMLTNSYRMLLAAICQLAYRILRRNFCTKNTPWHESTCVYFGGPSFVPAGLLSSSRPVFGSASIQ